MRTKLLLCLLSLLSTLAWGDGRSVQQLSELDSRSQLLCASALLYFTPLERDPDPRALTAVFYHLQSLDTTIVQLGQPAELEQPLRVMQQLFRELDGLPRSQRQRYPQLLQQLLAEQQKLREAAAKLQAPLTLAEVQARLPLNAQSSDLASLLLDYQLRHYPLPEQTRTPLATDALQALDRRIEQRFDTLMTRYPAHLAELRKIQSSYHFVRAELQQSTSQTHGGAEFYLGRAVTDLEELALTVAGEANVPSTASNAN
ncbi:hypothetical protein JQX08_07015 [Pseudomonas sp. UL073]|uniref:Uncharacterized protein n=1 Tax=Zestomonas insulae TaxID=2809017 RepID=A0ABS2IF38_9GAMM|nr:hypothetical protein [Pseudomonas insulae]MBM7060453.1 hypothetical protein [Pseudomonas insulae]